MLNDIEFKVGDIVTWGFEIPKKKGINTPYFYGVSEDKLVVEKVQEEFLRGHSKDHKQRLRIKGKGSFNGCWFKLFENDHIKEEPVKKSDKTLYMGSKVSLWDLI